MPKLILTKGLPASGKSTWAREQVAKSKGGTVGLTKDDLRLMFADTKKREKLVLETRNTLTKLYLEGGLNVIWHDTNLNPIHELKAKEIAKEHKSSLIIQDFTDVDVQECIKRDSKRLNSVGEKVIINMHNQYLAPKAIEYIEDKTLSHIILCDIDGTVAIKGDRSIFDWSKVSVDLPNEYICQVVKSLIASGNEIVFFSGRDEICRDDSKKWLQDNLENLKTNSKTNQEFQLFMRPEGDMRSDTVIKKELFEANIRGKYYVDFVIDDRMSVIRMWQNELGIPVLSANPLAIEF